MPILIAVAALAVVIYAALRIKFWVKEGAKLQISGYLPPKPSWIERIGPSATPAALA